MRRGPIAAGIVLVSLLALPAAANAQENVINDDTYSRSFQYTRDGTFDASLLWDDCWNEAACGVRGLADTVWVEFDLGEPHQLSRARLRGVPFTESRSTRWVLKYRSSLNEDWETAFSKLADGAKWFEEDLDILARYVRLELRRLVGATASEAREFELYGTPQAQRGAQGADVPALPGGSFCHLLSGGSQVPRGFGAPYETLSGGNNVMMRVLCNQQSAQLSFETGAYPGFIYQQAYVYDRAEENWRGVTLNGASRSGQWLRGSASADVALSTGALAQQNYVLGYICLWDGSGWKCGCRDRTCSQSYWQLQAFRK